MNLPIRVLLTLNIIFTYYGENAQKQIISKKICFFKVPLTPEEVSDLLKEQSEQKEVEAGYTLNQDEFDRLHYETDNVKHLREAQVL